MFSSSFLSDFLHSVPGKNIEPALLSIAERLRALEHIYSLRFAAPRWELTIESQNRKLESLESKITRIETLLELKIDKLTEGLTSKTLKEELSKEQLSRKIDTVYERLNHRMSYMESRIENNIVKQLTNLDSSLKGISQQIEPLEKSYSEVEGELMEISNSFEEIKNFMANFNNSLTSQQNDNSFKNISDETLKKVEKNMVNQFNSFALKISDMYNEMTRRGKLNEDMLKNTINLFNITRKEFQETVQILKSYRKHPCQTIPDDTYDYLLEKIETMTRKNDGNYQRLDTTIERLHEKQELYQESCHRLQLNEPQIENRIGQILEKILDSIDNRTYTTDKNYDTIMEKLKTHHTHIIRSVGHTSNAVVKLSEQISNDFKALYYDIAVNNPTIHKIDTIIGSLKQLQEQFFELNLTLTHSHQLTPPYLHNQEVLNTTETILSLMQNLNENINVIIEKLNQYYRSFPETFESDESTSPIDFSKKILNIFNMTEEDLYKNIAKDAGNPTTRFERNGKFNDKNDEFDQLPPFLPNEDDYSSEKDLE
ncbi:hypothetical protein RUM44_013553 [Polyplax serrata]|uniref:Autophagy-related protein 17 n=1 Tax=Polyplax serrata TaxID=468196 RepID=A0ABR1BEH1_POLSC